MILSDTSIVRFQTVRKKNEFLRTAGLLYFLLTESRKKGIVFFMNKMNGNTIKITTGAMILAIFAMMLLLNRQTGSFFEGFFIYLLPIPMVLYAALYGFRAGLSVFAGMCLFSFLFGGFTTIFYAVTAALLGLIFGTRIYLKCDMTRTLFIVMGLSAVFNVVSTVALASLFGYDVTAEVTQMRDAIGQALAQMGNEEVMQFYTLDFMKQIFIISTAVIGLIDGFIVYRLSLFIAKRLRISTDRAIPIKDLYPPKWTGIAAILLYIYGLYSFIKPSADPLLNDIRQGLWVIGFMYLVVFGIIALTQFFRAFVSRSALVITLLTILAYFVLSQVLLYVGFAYISLGLHDYLKKKNAAV